MDHGGGGGEGGDDAPGDQPRLRERPYKTVKYTHEASHLHTQTVTHTPDASRLHVGWEPSHPGMMRQAINRACESDHP